MRAWVKSKLSGLKTSPDGIAMSVGLVGVVMLVTGLWMIYVPSAFIALGVILLSWSFMAAKAIARGKA